VTAPAPSPMVILDGDHKWRWSGAKGCRARYYTALKSHFPRMHGHLSSRAADPGPMYTCWPGGTKLIYITGETAGVRPWYTRTRNRQ